MAHSCYHFVVLAFILLAVACSLSEQLASRTYTCQEQISHISSDGKILLHLKHPIYEYLHPEQHCEMRIRFDYGRRTHSSQSTIRRRWLVSVVNASIRGYSASAKFYNSISSQYEKDAVGPPLTSATRYLDSYQFVTEGDSFTVVFETKIHPEIRSTGLVLLAELFMRCPEGWFDTGISCYGIPFRPDSAIARKADSEAACARLGGGFLSRGIYSNDHIDESIRSLLALQGKDGFGSRHPFWVGMVRYSKMLGGEGPPTPHQKFVYTSSYQIPYKIEEGDCHDCGCVVYHSGRFISENCDVKHRYICVMPLSIDFCIASSHRPTVATDSRTNSQTHIVGKTKCSNEVVSSAWRSAAVTLFVLTMLAL